MSDLKDFLENIRKFSPKIGEVAMRHVSGLSLFLFYLSYVGDQINYCTLMLILILWQGCVFYLICI